MPHYVFLYPQIQRLTGAQRLILALAGAVATLPDPTTGQTVRLTLLTHRLNAECRPALPPAVGLIETGYNLNLSGNHYLDSLAEYLAVPFLLPKLPPDATALCFFGPPSLPGLWWARWVRRLKIPLLYFCYEPPRAAYTDRREVSRRMGRAGLILQPLLRLYRPLDRYLARQADALLVNGEYGQSLIRQTYGLASTIITHGAELGPGQEGAGPGPNLVRLRYGLGDRPVILTVNHLHPRKRVDLLLRAMPAVRAEHPGTTALIVGGGPEKAALQELARTLGLDDQAVIFAGYVPEEELAAHYAAATVYAHTGRAETFGLSVLEAQAAALPVVATDEGGPREIILESQTGFLVEATPAALAERLNWLLSHPAEREAMGQAGAERVAARYTWERGARAFVEVARHPAR